MNAIVTELSNPVWWVSVVLAGIAINLFTAYLKTTLDSVFENTFSWWRESSKTRKEAWQLRIEELRKSEELRKEEITKEFRSRLYSIHQLLVAIIFMMFPYIASPMSDSFKIVFFSCSAITFFLAFIAGIVVDDTTRALVAASNK